MMRLTREVGNTVVPRSIEVGAGTVRGRFFVGSADIFVGVLN